MKKIQKTLAALIAIMLTLTSGAGLFGVSAQAARGAWLTTWGSSLVNGAISLGSVSFQDVILPGSTIRTELPVTTAGSKLTFTFSNQYGAADITIDEAGVAKTKGNGQADIIDGTQLPITFNGGQTSVTIPAGKTVTSDKVEIKTEALEYISVSLYFSHLTYMTSVGLTNGRTFMKRGILDTNSQVNSTYLLGATEVNLSSGDITYHTIPFLERIDSLSSDANASAAVFIGDSTLVNNTYLYYAQRLLSAGVNNISVVNEAIVGNKLLSDGSGMLGNLYGQALIDRFRRDVVKITGVKYCFVKIGVNDILHQFSKSLSDSTPKHTVEEIIDGYRSLITQCHKWGIKIYFFTKSAWKGYDRNFLGTGADLEWNEEAQKMCDEISDWIMNRASCDGYIDCSELEDPSDRTKLCSSLTLDGIHFTDLGAVAMADLIPLSYVGADSEGKTAAELVGVDPYAEKRQILAAMSGEGSSSSAGADNKPDEPSSAPQETTSSVPESTTAPSADTSESNTAPAPGDEILSFETPEGVTSPSYAPPPNQDVNYVISDDYSSPASIGDGANIGFVLAFVLVAAVAITMSALTLARKKEND
ncbi:MAG: hypothetical protein J1E34_03935 [Oscillospiraceae bacterium]|nr:hypothetical protein [Oscillospiraceae bacterium]